MPDRRSSSRSQTGGTTTRATTFPIMCSAPSCRLCRRARSRSTLHRAHPSLAADFVAVDWGWLPAPRPIERNNPFVVVVPYGDKRLNVPTSWKFGKAEAERMLRKVDHCIEVVVTKAQLEKMIFLRDAQIQRHAARRKRLEVLERLDRGW